MERQEYTEQKSGFLSFLVMLYLIISQIMTVYFWWDFGQTNSLLKTIFLGFFVAEFKGFLWFLFY